MKKAYVIHCSDLSVGDCAYIVDIFLSREKAEKQFDELMQNNNSVFVYYYIQWYYLSD